MALDDACNQLFGKTQVQAKAPMSHTLMGADLAPPRLPNQPSIPSEMPPIDDKNANLG
jgi:hypothetical protein